MHLLSCVQHLIILSIWFAVFSFLAEVRCTIMSLKMFFSAWPYLHPKTKSEMLPSLTGWALRRTSLTVWYFGWHYCLLLPEGKRDGLICITYFKEPNIIQICWIIPVFSTHVFYFHDLVICKLLHVSQNVSYWLTSSLVYRWVLLTAYTDHINMSFLFYFWHQPAVKKTLHKLT